MKQNQCRLGIAAIALIGLFAPGRAVYAQREAKPDRAHTIRPIVVMKQSEISGRIFVLQSEPSKGVPTGEKGSDIKIEVRASDQSQALYKTVTDKDGHFVLPNLDVGAYHLKVGRLLVDLNVDAPPIPGSTEASKQVPKTIVLFIPKEVVD